MGSPPEKPSTPSDRAEENATGTSDVLSEAFHAKIRRLVAAFGVGVLRVDAESQGTYTDSGFEEMWGLQRSEISEAAIVQLIHPDDVKRVAEEWRRMQSEAAASYQLEYRVCDNGVGIPSASFGRIFSYGFTTKQDGHGFGLHRSQALATEMGGTITVASEGLGHGATFCLHIPRHTAPR